MRDNPRLLLGCALSVVLVAGAASQAAEIGPSSLEPGQEGSTPDPLPGGLLLTQNVDPGTVTSGSGIACQAGLVTTDNQWYRRFDLDGDHGITGLFYFDAVNFGVEVAQGGPQDVEVIVSCIDGNADLTTANIDAGIRASSVVSQPDTELSFTEVFLAGAPCEGETEDLVAGVRTLDCLETGRCTSFILGANDAGEIRPGYISAPDCGIVDPLDLGSIGFPNSHILISVVPGGLGPPPQPSATGPLGAAFMVAVFIATSTFFWLRRRPAT